MKTWRHPNGGECEEVVFYEPGVGHYDAQLWNAGAIDAYRGVGHSRLTRVELRDSGQTDEQGRRIFTPVESMSHD